MKDKKQTAASAQGLARDFKITNKFGMHARPAALFVKTAGRFGSDIMVEKDGTTVSGKSIMGLLTLELHQGATLRVTADGPDAKEALQALEQLIANKFFED